MVLIFDSFVRLFAELHSVRLSSSHRRVFARFEDPRPSLTIPSLPPRYYLLSFSHRRNTELAQQKSTSKAARLAVWGPIQKSLLARAVKESDEARALAEANASASTPAGIARTAVFELSPSEVITSAEEVIQSLDESMEIQASLGVVMEEMRTLIEKGKVLRERLEEIVQATTDGDRLQVLLGLVDRLSSQLEKGIKVASAEESGNAPVRSMTGNVNGSATPASLSNARQPTSSSTPTNNNLLSTPTPASRVSSTTFSSPHHAPTPLSFVQSSSTLRQPSTPTTPSSHRPDANESITSPSFSIADSDTEEEDSDAEELTANPRQQSFNIPLPPSTAVPLFDVDASSNSNGVEEKIEGGTGEFQFLTVEGEEGGETAVESSPTTRKSTGWTEEEGEVFRKGAALLALEDDEEVEEVSGEELRKEVSLSFKLSRVRGEGRQRRVGWTSPRCRRSQPSKYPAADHPFHFSLLFDHQILETPLERPAPRRLSVDLDDDETSAP